MRIILEETITKQIKTGVGKHTAMLNNLIENSGYEYKIISNDFIGKIKNAVLKRVIFLIWLNTCFFFKLLFQKKDTVVIYTSFPPLIKLKKIKQVGIIHDVLFKKYPTAITSSGKINNLLLNILITSRCDIILTNAETVKQEILEIYNLKEDRIKVVYNTFSLKTPKNINEDEILKKFNLSDCKKLYFISVSSMNKNKNIDFLINTFNDISSDYPDIKLVLVGNHNNNLKQYENRRNNNIFFTGYISDEELAVLYKNALAFAFPSIYEGFGIPIIDAQMLGVPVICSDIPIFREVAQDSALLCDLTTECFSKGLKDLIENPNLRMQLIEEGSKNSVRFAMDEIKFQFKNILNI